MDNGQLRVLLVEDDPDDYLLTSELLKEIPGSKITLDWAKDFDGGLAAIMRCEHDCYLVDYRLGKGDGLALLGEALRAGCKAPVILLTGQGDRALALEALEAGAADYLVKGEVNAVVLERSIRYALQQKRHALDLEGKVVERTAALEQANAALRENQDYLRRLLDSMAEGFYGVDEHGVTTVCNAAFLRILGFARAEDAIGRKLHDVIHHTHPDGSPYLKEECPIYRCASAGEPAHVDNEFFFRLDGSAVPVEYWAYPVIRAGERRGAITTFYDITERKRAELNRAFLASISEDLVRLTTEEEIMPAAGAKIGAHLHLSLCVFGDINEAADEAVIKYQWHRDDVPGMSGVYRLSEFLTKDFQRAGRAGEIFVVRDTASDSRIAAAVAQVSKPAVSRVSKPAAPGEAPAGLEVGDTAGLETCATSGAEKYAALKIGSFVSVPLVRDGRWQFILVICHSMAHDWREEEIELIRETTTRLWTRLERARAEEALREAGERFRFLAESMPQKIFTAKPNGEVDYFNREWTEFTGLSFDKMRAWGWVHIIHPEDVEENVRRWQHSIDTGEPFEFEHRFLRLDGHYRWHVSRAVPMRDAQGAVLMWIGSNTDIQEQKHNEEVLRQSETRVRALFETAEAARLSAEGAKTRAERATRAKDDFLAALSHELRTPLSPALLLATSLADDATLPPRVREDIDAIGKGIALQAQLVDDLLDITRITGGKLRLDLRPIDAHTALRHAYEIVRTEAKEREIEVTLHLTAAHDCIRADAVRVQQIFWNVLKNAVKFTPPGGAITVRTRNVEAAPPPLPGSSENERQAETRRGRRVHATDMLLIEITDTGVGIEPEMLGNIFDTFIQEEHDRAHRFGGIGLGLAIARRLVELQNGTIRAESRGRNYGATFRIALPLEAAELCAAAEPEPPPLPAVPPAPRHILLVEDHEQTRATLARLLQNRGHAVAGVATSAAARERAAAGEFDLVISDLGLPDGDGHTLMAELRDAHGLPGIALSGYGMDEDIAHSRKSGFFTHLTKPIDIHALEAAIAAAPRI